MSVYEEARKKIALITEDLNENAPQKLGLSDAYGLPDKWQIGWRDVLARWRDLAGDLPDDATVEVTAGDIRAHMDRVRTLVNDTTFKHLETLRLNEELHEANMQCTQLLAERDERRRNK